MQSTLSAEAKLQAVIRSARAILEEKSFEKAARAIFDRCRELTGAVSGYVALLSDDGYENEVLFLDAGGMPCTVDPDLPMPIRGLRSQAYETGKAVFDNSFMNSGWVQFLPPGHVALRNVMFAPLNIEGRTVGIMGLANKPSDFTAEDAEMASVLGELAAISLLNSHYIDMLNEKTESLERALAQIRTLRGLLPICSHCKSIRDDKGFWTKVEAYISEHVDVQFSHGLCPDCLRKLYPEHAEKIAAKAGSADKA